MTTEPQHENANQEPEWHLPRTRGVFVKLYPDTKLAEEWYEGEFSIRGGFAKAYLIGLGEMLEIGIAEKQDSPQMARQVYEAAKSLSDNDSTILMKLASILRETKDNPKYSYVRRLLEVLASWPVHTDQQPEIADIMQAKPVETEPSQPEQPQVEEAQPEGLHPEGLQPEAANVEPEETEQPVPPPPVPASTTEQ